MSREVLLSFAVWAIEGMFMTRIAQKQITKTIRVKRKQLSAIRAEVEDLFDYLDVLEARARDNGKPQLSHADAKKRYGLK